MTQDDKLTAREEMDALLPWYVTGRLSPGERLRVEAALEADPELRRRLDIVREEHAETVALNEALPAAPRGAADRLFALIDAEPERRPEPAAERPTLGARIAGLLGLDRAGTGTLGWLGAAAAIVVLVQAGFLASGLLRERAATGSFTVATAPAPEAAGGTIALVAFQPTATAADITAVLESAGASLVDGPQAGMYRVRLSADKLEGARLDEALSRLRQRAEVVRLAVPGG